ncbi:hypothetical protein [uncultured Methanobrevibacter sp.]|uniref:hypothetical protein n=1 Tax=uncultured Methanobrevibacter sp. TaxID=253161 RepID=UPI0025DE23A7|nr:hypothetical protein [uncultured Methanobrevibacter sp.]
MFRLLGYDTENPDEVMPSMPVMWGLKPQKKVDLAILIDGEVKMLVECKSAKNSIQITSISCLDTTLYATAK